MNLRDLKVGDKFLPTSIRKDFAWYDQIDEQIKVIFYRSKENGGGSYKREGIFCFSSHIDKVDFDWEWEFEVIRVNKKSVSIKWKSIDCVYNPDSKVKYTYKLVDRFGMIEFEEKKCIKVDWELELK